MMEMRTLNLCALAAALAGITNGAQASGFQLEQNSSGLGNAYVGQAAAAENASTIYYNPAGMTLIPGKQVLGAVHFIGNSAKFTDNGGSVSATGAPISAGGGTNGGDAGAWNPTGDAYLSWQLSPKLWVGVGLTIPFGLKTEYDPAFIGRFQSQKAELRTYDLNPSIAYKVNEAFSIGAGLSFQHAKVTLDRSFFAFPPGLELPERVNLDDDSWGWNIGAMFRIGSHTRIGLNYRAPVEHNLSGTASVTGVGTASAEAPIKLPDMLSWGISHQLNDKWQLLGDLTYTHWSTMKNVPLVLTSAGLGALPAGTTADVLDFQFRDTYRVGIGANYQWTERFTLKLGTAYEQTPVPDAAHRTVILPDNDRRWLAIGGKYHASKQSTWDFGYAHLFVVNGGTFRNKLAQGQGIVSGSYKAGVDILGVQYTFSF